MGHVSARYIHIRTALKRYSCCCNIIILAHPPRAYVCNQNCKTTEAANESPTVGEVAECHSHRR